METKPDELKPPYLPFQTFLSFDETEELHGGEEAGLVSS